MTKRAERAEQYPSLVARQHADRTHFLDRLALRTWCGQDLKKGNWVKVGGGEMTCPGCTKAWNKVMPEMRYPWWKYQEVS